MPDGVTIIRGDTGERPDPNAPVYLNSGRYTNVIVNHGGRSYLSRFPGWDTPDNEGHQRAQFERRLKPGFYAYDGRRDNAPRT